MGVERKMDSMASRTVSKENRVTELILWSGDVQEKGFRRLIKNEANLLVLKGLTYNLPDGRVAALVKGTRGSLDELVAEVERKAPNLVADIQTVDREEMENDLPLPNFKQVKTENIERLSEKFDVGIELLRNLKDGQEKLAEGQEEMVGGQKKAIETLQKIDKTLEKVAENTS